MTLPEGPLAVAAALVVELRPRREAGYHLPAVSILSFPPYRLDPAEHRLWRGSTPVELRPKTFAALTYLAERPGKLVQNDELQRIVDSVEPAR
jgi:DNA-binding response OmpR family regulator